MDTEVEKALRGLIWTIQDEFPELRDILQRAKEQGLDEQEAMAELIAAVTADPAMAQRFEEAARKALFPLRAEDVPESEPRGVQAPAHLFDSGVGLPRINPLFEAALIERRQFDGDMPEFRSGPLLPGVKPSVPVDSKARSPVALGSMLATASDQVAVEVEDARKALALKVEELSNDGTAMVPVKARTDLAAFAQGSAETDPVSYRRGALPAPVKVPDPSGAALAVLGTPERQQLTWDFFSTSQGRRSVLSTIWEGVVGRLLDAGVEVAGFSPPTTGPGVKVEAYAEWTCGITGKGNTSSEFAFVDTAIAALAKKLMEQAITGLVKLEVYAINTVDVRSVGWAARLVR